MLARTVIRQGKKIFEQDKQIKKLKEENRELRNEVEENKIDRYEFKNLFHQTVFDLFNLQEINSLGIDEEEKNKHRNVIINKLIKEFMQKEKELSSLVKNIDNPIQ